MIVVDTSAILAILLKERHAEECEAVLEREDRRMDVRPVTRESALWAAAAHALWGKGVHPAALNFSDCFAYELAKQHGCKLLCVGNDFRRTDIDTVP